MRQEPEFFGERELELLYIGRKLGDALAIEAVLTEAGIDYAVEVDYYTGGVIFRRSRAGAFIYVDPEVRPRAVELLRLKGHQPVDAA